MLVQFCSVKNALGPGTHVDKDYHHQEQDPEGGQGHCEELVLVLQELLLTLLLFASIFLRLSLQLPHFGA
jgi:hypothetical protein